MIKYARTALLDFLNQSFTLVEYVAPVAYKHGNPFSQFVATTFFLLSSLKKWVMGRFFLSCSCAINCFVIFLLKEESETDVRSSNLI